MRPLARAIQIFGGVILCGGLLWVKGPAITLPEYLGGFAAALLGLGILLFGGYLELKRNGES